MEAGYIELPNQPSARTEQGIREGEIHIWTIDLDSLQHELPRLQNNLTHDELTRAARLRSLKARQNFVAARSILRAILSRYTACAPESLAFGHGPHGKPFLRSPQDTLEFNLSHSNGRALIAVSRGIPLGVDVEAVRPVDEMETIMANYFSPLEREQLRGLPAFEKPEGFFNAWTRKEAYVKGRGDGFHLPLNRFSVSLVPGRPARLLDESEKQPGSDGWRLVNLALAAGAGYCAALAYRSQAACRLIFQSVQAYAANMVDIDRPIQVEY
jgi:4'-phosphopantetheinyl transferase